jgi:hypothetical protein
LLNFFIFEITKLNYLTHAFLQLTFPIGHPQYEYYQKKVKYWENWFSHTRDEQIKGFVVLNVSLKTNFDFKG